VKIKKIVFSILLSVVLVITTLLGCVAGDPWQEDLHLLNLFVHEAGLAPQFATRDGTIWLSGDIRSQGYGMFTACCQGLGLWVRGHNAIAPLHTGVGSFDYTGGIYENLFTATTNIFEAEDAELHNWIIVLDETTGYAQAAEIELFLDAQNVILHTMNWTNDLTSVDFGVFSHPIFMIGAGGCVHIDTKGRGDFVVHSDKQTATYMVNLENVCQSDDVRNTQIDTFAMGYEGVRALDTWYCTGDLQPNDYSSIVVISADETGAVSSDVTTHFNFLEFLTTDNQTLDKHAIHVGQGFDLALEVSGGLIEQPDYGYQVTLANVPTDRVTGVPPDGTAFLDTSASDVLIFGADGDYILIGSDATFEAIEVILTNIANKDILEEYYYSTGVGTWAVLHQINTVRGFRQSGIIAFEAPAGWAKSNVVVPAGAAINNAFYVKVVRTRNALGAPPVEGYFKTYTTSSTTDFLVRGDGTLRPVEMADAFAPNNSLYYSLTQNKLVYKDNGGVVHDLW